MQQDRVTRLAVKEAHLDTALTSLRKAIVEEDEGPDIAILTEIAARVAMMKQTTERSIAAIKRSHAQFARAALDAD